MLLQLDKESVGAEDIVIPVHATHGFFGRVLVANGAQNFGASGLPPGLAVNAASGLISGVPSTPGTYQLVGEAELRMMKPSAYLINVGRGNTVDEEALVRACEEKRIAGAGLDAFTAEPLPKESKLWDLPNVFFSPHVSGRLKNYNDVTTKLFCENLMRYVSSRRLFNVVNKKRGY